MTKRIPDGLSAREFSLLDAINTAASQAWRSPRQPRGRWPSIMVTGLPRSGTTLATQILAQQLDVSYVSNIAAPFWRAPAAGLHFAAMVGGRDMAPPSRSSVRGRTREPANVHEFGWFWARHFRMNGMAAASAEGPPTWRALRQDLQDMTRVFDRPLVLKSFHILLDLRQYLTEKPDTLIVAIRRDHSDIEASLRRARREAGTPSLGLVPRSVKQPDRPDIAEQVRGLMALLDYGLATGDHRIIEVQHTDLVSGGTGLVDRVIETVLDRWDVTVRRRGESDWTGSS